MVALFLGIFVVAFGTFIILCAYARPFMGKSVSGGACRRQLIASVQAP